MTEKKPLWKERQDAITSMPNYRIEQLTHKQLDEEAATQMGWTLVESDSWNNQEAYFCDFNHKKIMTVSKWNPSTNKGQAHEMLDLALLNFWLCDMHMTCNSFDIVLSRVLGPKDTTKRIEFCYDTKDIALALTRASVSALWANARPFRTRIKMEG